MKALILAIGKCKKNSPEAAIIAEYIKRSGWEVIVKEKDNSTQEDEAKFLQSAIPHGAKVIVLDERGENMSSLDLAHKVGNWLSNGTSEICFLIVLIFDYSFFIFLVKNNGIQQRFMVDNPKCFECEVNIPIDTNQKISCLFPTNKNFPNSDYKNYKQKNIHK